MSLQNPKIKENNSLLQIIKQALIFSTALSGGLFFCFLLPQFWTMPLWEQGLLIFGFCLPIFWLVKKLAETFLSSYKNTKIENFNLGLIILIASLLSITLSFNTPYIDSYLPDVKLQISLDPKTEINDNISIEAPQIALGDQALSQSPEKISANCSLHANTLVFSNEEPCQIIYSIPVSRPETLHISLPDTQYPIDAHIRIRHINYQVDLSEIGSKYIQWNEDISPTFSPKKIRYPIIGISIYFLISFFFLGIYKISKTGFYSKLHQIGKYKKVLSNVIIILLFCFIAFFYTAGRLGANPWNFVDLQSDAANIASFAAAYAHPENFVNDAFLSNPANFQAYFTFHVLLIRTLGSIFGNYASAFTCLLFPTILITLFGTYWLGYKLFKNRLLAFLLSIISLVPVSLPVYEYYGLGSDIIPRALFQALLPFALILLHHSINKPEKWWLCSVVFTLLFYIHPVSGPAWLMALFLSFIMMMIINFQKFLWKPFFISLGISFAGLLPFVQAFFVPSGSEVYDISLIKQILDYRLTIQTVSIVKLYQQYVESSIFSNLSMIILWVVSLGFLILFIIVSLKKLVGKHKNSNTFINNETSVLLFSWWFAILFASIAIPYLDEIYMEMTGNLPILREIRRNLRYFLPLLWLTFFWISSQGIIQSGENNEKPLSKAIHTNLLILSFLIAGIFVIHEKPLNAIPFQNSIHCLHNGKLICEIPENTVQKVTFYDHVCDTVQPDDIIFPDPSPAYLGDSLIPRYYCQRSIAYTYKDGSGAGNTSMQFIENWWNITQDLETMLPTNETPLNPDVFQYAKSLGADYFILINPDPENMIQLDKDSIVYKNNYGILYKIH